MSTQTDTYQRLTNSGPGRLIAGRLGLPRSQPLRRYEPGQPLLTGPALLGAAPGGHLRAAVERVLRECGAELLAGEPPGEGADLGALVFDASGIADSTALRALYDFLHAVV